MSKRQNQPWRSLVKNTGKPLKNEFGLKVTVGASLQHIAERAWFAQTEHHYYFQSKSQFVKQVLDQT